MGRGRGEEQEEEDKGEGGITHQSFLCRDISADPL